jgi:hypothetical protein
VQHQRTTRLLEANPIELKVGKPGRIYLLSTRSLTPLYKTDVVHLGVADRGIIELSYESPGRYMFHARQVQ